MIPAAIAWYADRKMEQPSVHVKKSPRRYRYEHEAESLLFHELHGDHRGQTASRVAAKSIRPRAELTVCWVKLRAAACVVASQAGREYETETTADRYRGWCSPSHRYTNLALGASLRIDRPACGSTSVSWRASPRMSATSHAVAGELTLTPAGTTRLALRTASRRRPGHVAAIMSACSRTP